MENKLMEDMILNHKIKEMIANFGLKGEFEGCEVFKSGHINTTLLINMNENGETKKYVLQKINKYVFKKPEDVMENIINATGHIKTKLENEGKSADRKVLNFLSAKDDKYYSIDNDGDYWRVYRYVDNSITYDNPTPEVMEESGKAFGEFQNMLADFDASKLHDIIPNFHNTIDRFKNLRNAIERDASGRAKDVEEIIIKYLALEDVACRLQKMLENGQLPLRVTHNDTKCNNVLFDAETGEAIIVIDLDTVMPGLVAHDFGDAIRFGANTVAEDAPAEEAKLDLKKFEAFTKGFMSQVGDKLTPNEISTLALGPITMALECGVRFLTDYIDGDVYFKTTREGQNLDRAKNQLALAEDMIRNYDKMQSIVFDYDKTMGN